MKKNKFVTFILSIVPGVGHFYLGLMQRGLQFSLAFFGLLGLGILTSEILSILLPIVWFYAMFDALQGAAKLNQGETLPDEPVVPWRKIPLRPGVIGWILVLLGLLGFARNNLGYGRWASLPACLRGLDLQSLVVTAFLIGFGLYLIVAKKSGGAKSAAGEDAR